MLYFSSTPEARTNRGDDDENQGDDDTSDFELNLQVLPLQLSSYFCSLRSEILCLYIFESDI